MELILYVIVLAFIFETMDSSAGMGFGTGLTPLLFILGFEPLQVVPILLISEAITGLTSGFFHHEFENVKFSIRRPFNKETKVMIMIAGIGCIAILSSVFLTYFAIGFSKNIIKTYVAILVLVMGVIGMIRLKNKGGTFRPKLLAGFAALAGFNKGVGAGGYGVSLAEGIVCVVGVATFLLISKYGVTIDYVLLPSIVTGGFLAALISPYMVRVLPNKLWRIVIPSYAICMGVLMITKLYIL
jgi:uncharacterized membrane protein YfcA